MTQVLSLPGADTYDISYLVGARLENNEGNVNYSVTLRNNANNVVVFTVSDTAFLNQAFVEKNYAMSVPSAGNYTLVFEVNSVSAGSDYSAVFDNVSVIPEPSTYAMVFGALSLGFVAWTRRKKHGQV